MRCLCLCKLIFFLCWSDRTSVGLCWCLLTHCNSLWCVCRGDIRLATLANHTGRYFIMVIPLCMWMCLCACVKLSSVGVYAHAHTLINRCFSALLFCVAGAWVYCLCGNDLIHILPAVAALESFSWTTSCCTIKTQQPTRAVLHSTAPITTVGKGRLIKNINYKPWMGEKCSNSLSELYSCRQPKTRCVDEFHLLVHYPPSQCSSCICTFGDAVKTKARVW